MRKAHEHFISSPVLTREVIIHCRIRLRIQILDTCQIVVIPIPITIPYRYEMRVISIASGWGRPRGGRGDERPLLHCTIPHSLSNTLTQSTETHRHFQMEDSFRNSRYETTPSWKVGWVEPWKAAAMPGLPAAEQSDRTEPSPARPTDRVTNEVRAMQHELSPLAAAVAAVCPRREGRVGRRASGERASTVPPKRVFSCSINRYVGGGRGREGSALGNAPPPLRSHYHSCFRLASPCFSSRARASVRTARAERGLSERPWELEGRGRERRGGEGKELLKQINTCF